MKRKLTDEEVTAIINSDEFRKQHHEATKDLLSWYKTGTWTPFEEASKIADKFKYVKPGLTKLYPGNKNR